MKTFRIYARESSDDINKAPPIERQIERGKQWGEINGYNLTGVYIDDGYSGGDWNRPEWNKSVREAKGRHYNLLWTWSQDRLARDTEQFLWYYRNLKENGINVVSDTEGMINMDDVGGKAKHISLAMSADLFRTITSDKVKRTYERKKIQAIREGKRVVWGRKEKIVDMDKILALRASGKGYKAIGKELGVSHLTIRRRLQNPPQEIKHNSNENEGVSNNPIK